jgi:sulfide:quinone oxidoreductase
MTAGVCDGTLVGMSQNPIQVLIAGGGVAGLETLLALRALAKDRVHVSMLAPEPDFVYRPLQTAEPFSFGHLTRRPLWEIADELEATLLADGLSEVFPDTRQVRTTNGAVLSYDALVVAVGAVAVPIEHAATFTGDHAREVMGGVLADLEQGYSRSVAFVAPSEGWTLPLYELAIMTAREVWAQGIDDVRFSIVTPEERPLGIFGERASTVIGEMLAAEGIEFIGSASPDIRKGFVALGPGRDRLEAERIVSLPRLRGPAITGLTSDAQGFIRVDAHGRVDGLQDAYAAGDATDFPIKQGGLATQQADAAAAAVAADVGLGPDPAPFRPVMRGLLLTGGAPLYLRAELAGADEPTARRLQGEVSGRALWWPPGKVAGRHLAPFLATARPVDLAAEPLRDRTPEGQSSALDRDEALQLALLLAEEDARVGDYNQALHALDAAAALAGGVLPEEWAENRARWQRELAPHG